MNFSFYAFRFHFRAIDSVHFPAGKAGNVFRGAFGTVFRSIACSPQCPGAKVCDVAQECPYARMFEPRRDTGPSGLADPPRPFVMRAQHLDGKTLNIGERFWLDVHVFDLQDPALAYFTLTFAQLAREGLGPRRGRVELERVAALKLDRTEAVTVFEGGEFLLKDVPEPLQLSLDSDGLAISRIRVRFLTPTELKSNSEIVHGAPPFQVLFGRVRDRVSSLAELYGGYSLDLDFAGMRTRSEQIRIVNSSIQREEILRRSSRTGDVHGLGGFVGEVLYAGEVSEFIPFLKAGYWTGAGRHTVWGNGAIETRTESSVLAATPDPSGA